jgi:hypothetical protein
VACYGFNSAYSRCGARWRDSQRRLDLAAVRSGSGDVGGG